MFNRKKDAKKFAENLATSRQLRSSAPSPLFQLGHKEQPVRQDQLKPTAEAPADLYVTPPLSEASASSPHGAAADSDSSADYALHSPPPIASVPPPSPAPVEPAAVVLVPIHADSDNDMAESCSFGPSLFTAAPSQDPKVWLASLRDYVAYKGLDEGKQLALFKLRLGETARDWLMALPDDNKDTFAHLSAAFLARFQPKDIEKYKFARDLFNQKQKPGQSVDAYVTDLRTKAAIVGLDAKSLLYVAISGLSSDIVTYVVQRSPATLDELLTHARVAELSRAHESARADDVVSQRLEHLSQQMCLLTEKMSSMTTATVENRRSRPPTPVDRHVTFSEQRPRSTSPYRREDAAYRSASQSPPRQPRGNDYSQYNRQRDWRQPNPTATNQQWQYKDNRAFNNVRQYTPSRQQNPTFCSRCGRANGHPNPLFCPMINKECFTCGKRGHSFKLCRSNGFQSRQNY
jgi:hypothetical protein